MPGGTEEAFFEGLPYEWWVEGGKKSIEAGQLVGSVRANNLDQDNIIYTLAHSYTGQGRYQTKISIIQYCTILYNIIAKLS